MGSAIRVMETSAGIIGLTQWLQTPAGRYVLEWEQWHLDGAVADLFGYHALQLGLPELDALRANRMPHRWVATDGTPATDDADATDLPLPRCAVALHCEYDALPFDSQSLDLVVLPHGLELARDPHQALREVERVLVPGGRVVIVGFNPTSLWGLRQWTGRLLHRFRLGGSRSLFLPAAGFYNRLLHIVRIFLYLFKFVGYPKQSLICICSNLEH